MERTLAIIKPDALGKKVAGKILERIESEGFEILAARMVRMTRQEAAGFYDVHRDKDFFESLIGFMSSGPAIVMVLEREGAINYWRDVMGATDPAEAEKNTLRRLYGTNIERNAVHGSDGPQTSATEIAYFFGSVELLEKR